jgi:tripeptide aminopeptidase
MADTAGAVATARATQPERDQVVDDFVRLCEIESPSLRERAMADAVSEELRSLGLEVEEDGSSNETGSDAGNLLARLPAPDGARTILFCAHLDTVPLDAPVQIERADGYVQNRNEAICGADNKAAVATILGAVRRATRHGAPVGIEILFTTCEELALRGAKAFDRSRLRSEFGFVFDHASPIGELIVAAPTYYRVAADFHGKAAHAGIRPEDGRNAIVAAATGLSRLEFGRLDERTTANVGRIEGGTASNVVAERCRIELEARSLDAARASEVASGMVDTLAAAASDAECDVETIVEELFRGFRLPRTAPPVVAAAQALEAVGIEPSYVVTGGGSDANVLVADGFPCLNVANGTERNHEPGERVSVDALTTMLDVTLALVSASA